MGDTVVATIDGRTYEIPEAWLVGYTTANDCTVEYAVAYWHVQQLAEEDDFEGLRRMGAV